jgi:hypothetical protein
MGKMRRPRALTVVMWFAGIYAVGAVIGISAVVAGIAQPTIGGMAVSRETWLRVAAPLVASIAGLMSLTSVGLGRHRTWARWPFMCIWPLIALYGLGGGVAAAAPWSVVWRAWIDAILFGSGSAWLFFRYGSSVAYFEEIRGRDPNRHAPSSISTRGGLR